MTSKRRGECDRITRPIISLLFVISRNTLLFYYFAPNIFALRNFPVWFSKLVHRLGMIVRVPTNPRHRKLFEIPKWELNGGFSHSWGKFGTGNSFFGEILGFYWERRSTFLSHPNTGNMLWMFAQVIPKAGNDMGIFPKLFPIGWVMGYISPSYSQNCEKYGHTSPSYSQNCEWYRNLYPRYSQNCD